MTNFYPDSLAVRLDLLFNPHFDKYIMWFEPNHSFLCGLERRGKKKEKNMRRERSLRYMINDILNQKK